MAVYYSRPKLTSLKQGDRLAFVRQFRRMSQQQLGERIGMPPAHARTLVSRLEKHDRDLKPDRLEAIAAVLNVNAAMLKRWDFKDPADLYYQLLWIEELCPDFMFRNTIRQTTKNKTHEFLSERYADWKKMRRRYLDGRIDFEEYWEWKLKKTDKGEDANE